MESVLVEMNGTGDEKIRWTKDDRESVRKAHERFSALKAKKFMAFRVVRGQSRGDMLDDFDPNAEVIIMTPPLAGG
jgi:hypothetical protein